MSICTCVEFCWGEVCRPEPPRLPPDFESATGVVQARKKFQPKMLRFTGDNFLEVAGFCVRPGARYSDFGVGSDGEGNSFYRVFDYLHDSFLKVERGDWLVEGSAGEHYVIAHAILISDYERTA